MRKCCFFFFLFLAGFAVSAYAGFNDGQKSPLPHTSRQVIVHPAGEKGLSQPGTGNFGLAGMHIRQQVLPAVTVARPAGDNNISPNVVHLILPTRWAAIDLFGNNRLSHNYPCHNFW